MGGHVLVEWGITSNRRMEAGGAAGFFRRATDVRPSHQRGRRIEPIQWAVRDSLSQTFIDNMNALIAEAHARGAKVAEIGGISDYFSGRECQVPGYLANTHLENFYIRGWEAAENECREPHHCWEGAWQKAADDSHETRPVVAQGNDGWSPGLTVKQAAGEEIETSYGKAEMTLPEARVAAEKLEVAWHSFDI